MNSEASSLGHAPEQKRGTQPGTAENVVIDIEALTGRPVEDWERMRRHYRSRCMTSNDRTVPKVPGPALEELVEEYIFTEQWLAGMLDRKPEDPAWDELLKQHYETINELREQQGKRRIGDQSQRFASPAEM